ncbi:helix-turn-helix domain-containing protein, partial [Bacteroidota bacterium]|nr:helix-turn-helix domain-containing protein [Bacteroidota bacterium]MDC3129966.1 helix-turn-helix domain-containing protein [Bacteroidota bacterium]MDC3229738.1 helix-turn-helix domain-containing protein [Bacteroidota bacterium]
MIERLKIWMNEINISQTNLAENIGVNKATISHIMSGRNKPSIDFFIKLKEYYADLDLNWIISGQKTSYSKSSSKLGKSVDKIVIMYDDKSFDELQP